MKHETSENDARRFGCGFRIIIKYCFPFAINSYFLFAHPMPEWYYFHIWRDIYLGLMTHGVFTCSCLKVLLRNHSGKLNSIYYYALKFLPIKRPEIFSRALKLKIVRPRAALVRDVFLS